MYTMDYCKAVEAQSCKSKGFTGVTRGMIVDVNHQMIMEFD